MNSLPPPTPSLGDLAPSLKDYLNENDNGHNSSSSDSQAANPAPTFPHSNGGRIKEGGAEPETNSGHEPSLSDSLSLHRGERACPGLDPGVGDRGQTGPLTIRGKQRSRMNAVKHGLRATDGMLLSTLNGHERAIFHQIRNQLHEDYQPDLSQEKFLVDRLAIQYLRLYRLYQLEQSATKKSLDDPLAKLSVLPHLDRLSRYDWRIERQIRTLHNRLYQHFFVRNKYSLTRYSPKD